MINDISSCSSISELIAELFASRFCFALIHIVLPTLEPPNSLFRNTINTVIEESGEKAIHYVKILFSGYLFLTWSNYILNDRENILCPV